VPARTNASKWSATVAVAAEPLQERQQPPAVAAQQRFERGGLPACHGGHQVFVAPGRVAHAPPVGRSAILYARGGRGVEEKIEEKPTRDYRSGWSRGGTARRLADAFRYVEA
jgi:hypothetical protein